MCTHDCGGLQVKGNCAWIGLPLLQTLLVRGVVLMCLPAAAAGPPQCQQFAHDR